MFSVLRALARRPQGWIEIAILSLCLQGCSGCGCGGGNLPVERISPEWVSYENEETPPPKPAATKRAASQPALPAVIKLAPAPDRPVDVASWTVDDFFLARDNADPALPSAAALLAKSAAKGNEEALWLLMELLEEKPHVAHNAFASQSANRPNDDDEAPVKRSGKLASIILPVLAACPKPEARQAVEKVLCGTLATDMPDAQAADLILASLDQVQQQTGDFDELFYQALTAPEKFREPDDKRLAPAALQAAAFRLIHPVATPAMRARLAEHVVNPDTPAPHRELFGPWLAALTPENVPAQIVLHNSSLLSQEAKARFRESFAARNSQALDALLGTTTGAASVSSAQKPQESGLFVTPVKQSPLEQAKTKLDPAAVAALDFWTPAFIDSIAADLTQVRDFGNARELMLLACNLPFPQVRSELHKVLLRQWDQGPAPFEKAGLTFDHIRDPGFLILAKSMPREEIKAPNRPGATSPKPTPEQQAKQAWLTASESFLGALNGRFYTASRLNPVRASPPSQNTPEPGEKPTPESTAGLPFSVHRGGIVVGEYHLSWPTDLEKRLPGVKVNPLVLHYVRIEGEERFSKVSDWYKRQLKTSITRTLPRGQWFDSLQHDTQKRMVRSVDVLITRGANTPLVATAPPESLTVEILWIEIPDPTA